MIASRSLNLSTSDTKLGTNDTNSDILHSLSHRGVLFLDELPEFGQNVLEVLRQPLEDKVVTISRAQGTVTYPANFMLIAAMNPCPCGYYGDPVKECSCSAMAIAPYQKKISGPLIDGIDIHVEVDTVDERAADLLLVAGDGHGGTTAFFHRIAVIAAGAGIHGCDQHKVRGVGDCALGTRDCDNFIL